MNLNETISEEIQKLSPSSIIELFELDTTELGGDIFRFHNGTNQLNQNLVWQGNEYIRFPIQVTGFEVTGQGQFPRPTVTVSNVMSAITTILLQLNDLINAKFTRKRTMLKYLDAVNFTSGVNASADPTVFLPDDIYYVDRKSLEDRDNVQFELASAADLQGVQLPQRVVIQSTCPWIYRGADCGYTGVPLYDQTDTVLPMPTSALAIAMRNAFTALLAAQITLANAQTDLATKTATMTAAQIYAAVPQYSRTTFPTYYVAIPSAFGSQTSFWDGVAVSIGTEYGAGEYVETVNNYVYLTNYYKIIQYTRDEMAYEAALAAYNAAVIARDDAQTALTTDQATFDSALAAVPSDDPVYTQDRCGKRLNSCSIRFNSITPSQPLNFGGFPGVAR